MEGVPDTEEDSFTFRDVVVVAERIVISCLMRERGIRPQVGWEGIGFFRKPRVVRVEVESVRRRDVGRFVGGRRGEGTVVLGGEVGRLWLGRGRNGTRGVRGGEGDEDGNGDRRVMES